MQTVKAVGKRNGEANKISPEDRPAHDWYRFVLSFPPHLVRDYLQRFGIKQKHVVLDPFCGTGTTLVECKKLGISCVGVEANPMAHFASRVKTDWSPDPEGLIAHAQRIAAKALRQIALEGLVDDGLPLLRNGSRQSIRNLLFRASRLRHPFGRCIL